jgi:FAD/FMN-containing dehydrogenase
VRCNGSILCAVSCNLLRKGYSNQLGETSDELVRAAYGENYARLAELKKKYDPGNVLRLNQNIKPG